MRLASPSRLCCALLALSPVSGPVAQRLLTDIHPGAEAIAPSARGFHPLGGLHLFSARSGLGSELWHTDGTRTGTGLLADLHTGSADSSPGAFTEFGGVTYFAAQDGLRGREPWRTDGTQAGTRLAAETLPGTAGIVQGLVRAGNLLFMAVQSEPSALVDWSIWVSDGTQSGTRRSPIPARACPAWRRPAHCGCTRAAERPSTRCHLSCRGRDGYHLPPFCGNPPPPPPPPEP